MIDSLLVIGLALLISILALAFSEVLLRFMGIGHPRSRAWVHGITLLAVFTVLLLPFMLGGDVKTEKEQELQLTAPSDLQVHTDEPRMVIGNVTGTGYGDLNRTGVAPSDRPGPPVDRIGSNATSQPRENQTITVMTVSEQRTDYNGVWYLHLGLLMAGVAAVATAILIGRRDIRRMGLARNTDPYIFRVVDRTSARIGIVPPRVMVTERGVNSFVFLFPTTLVISAALLRNLNKRELRSVIYHELAHIKNRDTVLGPILLFLRVLFIYNPAVHILARRLERERELQADITLIRSKRNKVSFMEALVKAHDMAAGRSAVPYAATSHALMGARHHGLDKRFDNIFTSRSLRAFQTVAICIIILASNIGIAAAAQRFVPVEREQKEEVYLIITLVPRPGTNDTARDIVIGPIDLDQLQDMEPAMPIHHGPEGARAFHMNMTMPDDMLPMNRTGGNQDPRMHLDLMTMMALRQLARENEE